MTDRHYGMLIALLPGLALAALASDAAAAGCYAIWMNCFSVVEPQTLATRAMFAVAAFLPFGAPSYAPFAAAGWLAARRGELALTRWLWLTPPLYTALVHASCIAFASAVLPARRIHPDLRFDLTVFGVAAGYAAVTRLAKPWLVRKPRRWVDA